MVVHNSVVGLQLRRGERTRVEATGVLRAVFGVPGGYRPLPSGTRAARPDVPAVPGHVGAVGTRPADGQTVGRAPHARLGDAVSAAQAAGDGGADHPGAGPAR